MDEKKFSSVHEGYFKAKFLDVDEYAAKLVSTVVNNMVGRGTGVIFTDAEVSYDEGDKVLEIEGVAIGITNEDVAVRGLENCVNAVRGLKSEKRTLAS